MGVCVRPLEDGKADAADLKILVDKQLGFMKRLSPEANVYRYAIPLNLLVPQLNALCKDGFLYIGEGQYLHINL